MKLRRLLLMIGTALLMVSCTNDNNDSGDFSSNDMEEVIVEEEMTVIKAKDHLEEISYRLVNAAYDEEGSFEKRSEIQAGLNKINSQREIINETYDTNESITRDLLLIADSVEETLNLMLNESNEAYDSSVETGKLIGIYSTNYLDGELPPSLQTMSDIEQIREDASNK